MLSPFMLSLSKHEARRTAMQLIRMRSGRSLRGLGAEVDLRVRPRL